MMVLVHGLFWGCYLEFREAVRSSFIRMMIIVMHCLMIASDIFLLQFNAYRTNSPLFSFVLCLQVVGEIVVMIFVKIAHEEEKEQKSKQ